LGAALAGALLAAPARPAAAAGIRPAPPNAAWRTECGACHVPYPPALLPARSWRELMAGLDRHFGTDASLDAAAAAEITAFLERNAGRDRGGPAGVRITETPWFRREHRKVPAATWSGSAVKSAANCAACHPAAERGEFDDDTVRVPR
jgi:hypothetical protein